MTLPAAWSLVSGAAAALAVPLWLHGTRLQRLLAPAPVAAPARLDPRLALRGGQAALRGLARLPASPWRATCLYRAVLACVLLRRGGVPARLRIGVGRGGKPSPAAHAWVEGPSGDPLYGEPAGRPLEPVRSW